ncbi:protein kinase [Dactylosporangium roseum]|uniref:Protein kinase n=1 Tax=Dactylosporangium roseum TaxID=47989 RepID=A0ABY5ZC96_9ACTN|nr:serine/threonine protein kinase [Dactylosporangium roseum]UWZ38610.1 protein kinase [Dactylosporangium roseum]
MTEAGHNDGADESGTPDLPLRAAAPARRSAVGDLTHNDPVRIDDYRLLGQLGVGGMGTVYLAQAPDGSRVAVKLVHAHLARDPRFRTRFAGEVRAAQRVPGFCTARVLDSGSHEERPYLVTEYLEGVPLSRLVTDDGPLDPAMLHSVALGVVAALAAIHNVGLVHRDLKPSNLMVTLGGVRVIDFGIARALDAASDVTGTGNIVGSLGWASPEQLRAEEPTAAMDIFGWGCLVAFAATGRHPFGGEEAAARAWKILEGEPDLSGIPDPVRDLVAAALARDPADRPDARQLLLGLAIDDLDTVATLPAQRRWLRGTSQLSRRRATSMAIAVPMALALVFAAAETTSELMGGSPGPGTRQGTTTGDEVSSNLSPQPQPQATGVDPGQRPNSAVSRTVLGNPSNGAQEPVPLPSGPISPTTIVVTTTGSPTPAGSPSQSPQPTPTGTTPTATATATVGPGGEVPVG